MQLQHQALHILLTHTLDPGLLCICSSISQQLHQAVKATVLDSIAHLLVAVLRDKRYELPTIEALQWLCVTAGPAALQSEKVVRAVLGAFAGFHRRLAVKAGEVLVKRGTWNMLQCMQSISQCAGGSICAIIESLLSFALRLWTVYCCIRCTLSSWAHAQQRIDLLLQSLPTCQHQRLHCMAM